MGKRYWLIAATALIFITAVGAGASAQEYLSVKALPPTCIGLLEAGAAHITLTPFVPYTVSLSGSAGASTQFPDTDYEGLFLYYYDGFSPDHPEMVFMENDSSFEFVSSATDFFAFFADLSLKDVADNWGLMTLEFTARDGSREILDVNPVFNCLGLRDFGAAEKILLPEHFYTMTVEGDAFTNGSGVGTYDGVYLFYREWPRPRHPILEVLAFGDETSFQMNEWGWIYAWLVDESYNTMGNNGGFNTITFTEITPVEENTWGAIKALYR
jgi:hypothetical protein